MKRYVLLFLIILVSACGHDRSGETVDVPSVASLPGVYAGVFPCDGCPGIPVTLWLRSDGRYFIEQRYPAVEGREAMTAHSFGRWGWAADEGVLSLKGPGPVRRFARPDGDTLMMQTHSTLEHRLDRDHSASEFSAMVRMVGVARMHNGNASFTECSTGFEVPISKAGDFGRFRHQYRSAGGQGEPVLVELEGRFSWARDGTPGALTIDRLVTVKAEGTCSQ